MEDLEVRTGLLEENGADRAEGLNARLSEAFREAYPEVPPGKLEHMARNFTQVLEGIIDIGRRVGAPGEASHMDVANSMVYWCTANTYLEDLHQGRRDPALGDPSAGGLSDGEMDMITRELVARVADWLIGLEVLRADPELLRDFVKGALVAGASEWESSRDRLDRNG